MATVPLLLRGRLLIATPPLVDPNFDRSVVLLLEHGEDGALGIILNRPSDTALATVLPEWHEHATAPGVVFSGGPVAPEAVIALARGGSDGTEGWVSVLGEVGTVDIGRDPAEIGSQLDALRVFVGYSGWSPGQLEFELEQEAWFVVATESGDPFSPHPDQLWRDVLRRQRGRVAMFANYPEDPETN
ncbi:MAG: putative transcriptional regulator [Actinomycetota bacterium]|nr:putative transcriptional regulator [Actinomycetota bacterium]